jgi:hypothetical protein
MFAQKNHASRVNVQYALTAGPAEEFKNKASNLLGALTFFSFSPSFWDTGQLTCIKLNAMSDLLIF